MMTMKDLGREEVIYYLINAMSYRQYGDRALLRKGLNRITRVQTKPALLGVDTSEGIVIVISPTKNGIYLISNEIGQLPILHTFCVQWNSSSKLYTLTRDTGDKLEKLYNEIESV